MELHQALKHIIKTEGAAIITDLRLINILDDFKAYESIPASKYILRAIIADGYASRLLATKAWNAKSKAICDKFILTTGFIAENTSYIFQSLAYGLDWISNITKVDSISSNRNNSPESQSCNFRASKSEVQTKWKEGMNPDEIEDYLFSILEYDASIAEKSNVKLENLGFWYNDENSQIFVSGEIVRTKRLPKDKWGVILKAILYDRRGRVYSATQVDYIENSSPNPKPFDIIWEMDIRTLSRIKLYWE